MKQEANKRILFGDEAVRRYEKIKAAGNLVFEAIVGSQSYGTNVASSDVDKKFIYVDTLEDILAGDSTEQLNISDDYVGYEIGRYMELLRKQNPNIIELLYTDGRFVEFVNPKFKSLVVDHRDEFLTNQVAFSFGQYASDQIQKAQGTNKKFMNPMDKERKTLLDFCWIGIGQGSESVKMIFERIKKTHRFEYIPDWMFGCVAIDHMKNCYHLFFDYESMVRFDSNPDETYRDSLYAHRKYNGIIDRDGVQIKLSSVEKGVEPIDLFYCNIEGFQVYCKDYKEYWEWVEKRNLQRFVENAENEHNYDRKNMMHCHRLLNMCIEILSGKGVNVFREDREYLLGIRNGNSTYKELVDEAKEKKKLIEELYQTTSLPASCDKLKVSDVLLRFRKDFYDIK